MSTKQLREISIAAARSQLRRSGTSPEKATMIQVEAALDEIERTSPNTLVAQWYRLTADNQAEWRRFTREFKSEVTNSQRL